MRLEQFLKLVLPGISPGTSSSSAHRVNRCTTEISHYNHTSTLYSYAHDMFADWRVSRHSARAHRRAALRGAVVADPQVVVPLHPPPQRPTPLNCSGRAISISLRHRRRSRNPPVRRSTSTMTAHTEAPPHRRGSSSSLNTSLVLASVSRLSKSTEKRVSVRERCKMLYKAEWTYVIFLPGKIILHADE